MEQQGREELYWYETVLSSPGPAKCAGDSNNSQQECIVECYRPHSGWIGYSDKEADKEDTWAEFKHHLLDQDNANRVNGFELIWIEVQEVFASLTDV